MREEAHGRRTRSGRASPRARRASACALCVSSSWPSRYFFTVKPAKSASNQCHTQYERTNANVHVHVQVHVHVHVHVHGAGAGLNNDCECEFERDTRGTCERERTVVAVHLAIAASNRAMSNGGL